MVDIARKIREIRKNLRMNQAEFADAIGTTQGSVSKWETGREKPRTETFLKISEVSKMNVRTVVSGREHGFRHPSGFREVTIVGNIQHGYSVEQPTWDEDDWFKFSLPVPSIWMDLELLGWLVKGKGTYQDFPPGTLVVTAGQEDSEHSSEIDYQNGDLVVVQEKKRGGNWEITIRHYETDGGANITLHSPQTTEFVPPIVTSWRRAFKGDVTILGLVVATIRYPVEDMRLVYIPDD